eukprot:311633-Chlamydomonas_euryale.AAC.12
MPTSHAARTHVPAPMPRALKPVSASPATCSCISSCCPVPASGFSGAPTALRRCVTCARGAANDRQHTVAILRRTESPAASIGRP